MTNPLSSRLDRDVLFMVPRDDAAVVAHELLHGANHQKAELLTAGVAVLFATMAERTGMDPQELFIFGRRILHEPTPHHVKGNVQMEALRDFAGLRVRNSPII